MTCVYSVWNKELQCLVPCGKEATRWHDGNCLCTEHGEAIHGYNRLPTEEPEQLNLNFGEKIP